MGVREEGPCAYTDQRDSVLLNRLIDTTQKTLLPTKISMQLVNVTAQLGVPNTSTSCQHVTSVIVSSWVCRCFFPQSAAFIYLFYF